ncbi:MAG: MoaD/ThiS family protein [Euryarchaeota archaeon]|nr:MoaD/ThiS family protein [Euryarchaeota archaeon]
MRLDVSWFPRGSGQEGMVELPPWSRVTDLLDELKETPDGVLVVRDGVPVPLDTPLSEGDAVRIVRTVSGG